MYKKAKPLFMHCQTPMHAGSGDDLGIVDLPIQRERHTSFPKIESSSLKGAIREAEEFNILKGLKDDESNIDDILSQIKNLNRVFGFDDGALKGIGKEKMKSLFGEKEKDFAGAIAFTDARLLLFPIKSMRGVFAWATCPKILKRFQEDIKLTEGNEAFSIEIPTKSTVSTGTKLKIGTNKVILEEYAFTVEEHGSVSLLAQKLQQFIGLDVNDKLIILGDDEFKDFANLSTEVITRTKIDNATGTVAQRALFTEEYLPAETVLYSLTMAHDEFRAEKRMNADEIMRFLTDNLSDIIQIGGNATLGKGLTKMTI